VTTTPTDARHFTEVPVYAGVLCATAAQLQLLAEFFTDAEPGLRTQLGRYLIARYNEEDTTDPVTEAAIVLHELAETADLLHTLAGATTTTDGEA
jgi:hypothetical protein